MSHFLQFCEGKTPEDAQPIFTSSDPQLLATVRRLILLRLMPRPDEERPKRKLHTTHRDREATR